MKRERDGYVRKVDMLQQQEKEKNRILAHNEKELEELFRSWQRTTEEHEKYKVHFYYKKYNLKENHNE